MQSLYSVAPGDWANLVFENDLLNFWIEWFGPIYKKIHENIKVGNNTIKADNYNRPAPAKKRPHHSLKTFLQLEETFSKSGEAFFSVKNKLSTNLKQNLFFNLLTSWKIS